MTSHRPARWPVWVTGGAGVVMTMGVLVWLGATYDSRGNPLIDGPIAQVMVALIGGGATLGAIVLQRAIGQIKHQVKNGHTGSNLRDDLDKVQATQEQVMLALSRLENLPAEIAGLRRDVGRQATTDQQTHADVAQLRQEFAAHIQWSHEYQSTQTAEMRIIRQKLDIRPRRNKGER